MIDLGFRARVWQTGCFKAFKRFSVLVVHRRAGKTVLAVMRLIDAALRCDLPMGRYGYLAPELKQAKRNAWSYLKKYSRQIPGTKINESEIWIEFANGARIEVFGADKPNSIRGTYFDGVAIDEVAQLKPELWGSVLRPMLADRLGWALFIGTPRGINLFSEIYYKAVADPDWYSGVFNCYQTDSLAESEILELQHDLTPIEFRQEMLCDFTASGDNTLIPIDEALAATKRVLEPRLYNFAPKILGVDVAWQGGDRNVMAPRQGLHLSPLIVVPGIPEKTFANIVATKILEWEPDLTLVDTTGGYGGEVVSRLHDAGHKKVQGVVFSWKASNERFLNLRAEGWFKMAEWIKGGASIPNDTQLISEMCAPLYTNDTSSNRLQLESKDDIRARIGMSPDKADAVAITFMVPVATPRPQIQRQTHVSAWS